MIPASRNPVVWLMAIGGLLGPTGCSGPEFGSFSRVPASERQVIRGHTNTARHLALPADGAFNIHSGQSSQNPGDKGTARGESNAHEDGKAFSRAEATDGGSASATFKIGHQLSNQTDHDLLVNLDVQFDLLAGIELNDQASPQSVASADLHLVIMDPHERVVARLAILQANSKEAVARAEGPQHRMMTARLEPGKPYEIALFGQVHVDTDPDAEQAQSAMARIEVDHLNMRLNYSSPHSQPATGAGY